MKWTKALGVILLSFALILPTSAQTLQDLMRISNGNSSKAQKIAIIGSVLYHVSQSQRQNQNRVSTLPNYPQLPQQRAPVYYPPPAPPHSNNIPGYRPAGYSALEVAGRPTRLDPSRTPLTINAGHPAYQDIVRHAVQQWNSAGVGPLFAMTQGQADLTVDWSGSRVSPGARAETRMLRSANQVVPVELSVRTEGRNREQLARILTHELGHVLGLDHSNDARDVMFTSEQNRPGGLTERDLQMVRWLYSQNTYTPIIGQTQRANSVFARNLMAEPRESESVCKYHNH